MSQPLNLKDPEVRARTIVIDLTACADDIDSKKFNPRVSDEALSHFEGNRAFILYVEHCSRMSYLRSSLEYDVLRVVVKREWFGFNEVEANLKAAATVALRVARRAAKV